MILKVTYIFVYKPLMFKLAYGIKHVVQVLGDGAETHHSATDIFIVFIYLSIFASDAYVFIDMIGIYLLTYFLIRIYKYRN